MLSGSGRGTRLGLLGLGLVVVVLFHQAILGRRVFFQRDVLSYWYPQVESFVRTVGREGAAPLWNPFFVFGLPMLEDPGYQVFYPPTWLNLLVGPQVYYTGFVAVHCFLAGAGVLMLARRLGLSPCSAFASAAAWSASGPFLSAANLNHHFAGAAWIPWVLVALDKALHRGTLSSAVALGSLGGLQLLAGSGDMCLITGTLGAGYLAHYCASGAQPPIQALCRCARVACVAIVFAGAVSAAQALPTLALLGSTPRAAQNPATNLYWSVHPLSLLDLFVDRVVADFPMSSGLRSVLFEGRQPLLASLYLGLPAVLLGMFALAVPGPRRIALWIFVGFAAALLFALGRHTPMAPALVSLPVFGLFRYPVKAMIPASMLWALLVGLGVEAWQRDWTMRDRRRALALACLAALVGAIELGATGWGLAGSQILRALSTDEDGVARELFAGVGSRLRVAGTVALLAAGLWWVRAIRPRPRGWLTAALLLLLLGDWIASGTTVNPLAPPELYQHKPATLEPLVAAGEGVRVFADPYPGPAAFEPVRGPTGWERWWSAALGALDAIRPPVGARWGIRGSFDGDFTGLGPPAQSALTRLLLRYRATPFAHRLLVLGGVDYVIGLHGEPFPGLRLVGEFRSVFASPIRVFRVEATLPKIYLVGRARFVLGEAATYAALANPGFDPYAEVILSSPPQPQQHVAGFQGTLRVLERRSDSLRLAVSANAPAYLVVLESHHPGWKAWVDGRPASVLKANALFRAVAVPDGAHTIEMRYRPLLVAVGLFLSALAFGVLSSLWLAARLRPRLDSSEGAH